MAIFKYIERKGYEGRYTILREFGSHFLNHTSQQVEDNKPIIELTI